MPTFRAKSQTVNLASPSMISLILETISLRDANFSLPDFGAFLMHSTYTRLTFLFPSPNCDIRHTKGPISSGVFSHQMLQRATQLWENFDVSPYFIVFVDASTNNFYYSGQWLCVFKWQIVCLTLRLTSTFTHRCVGIELPYTGLYWVFFVSHVDHETEGNKQFFSNGPRYLSN
jgi:hypothetical protein